MIFRVEKNKNYTVMSNYHFKDKRLSLKAKGLLSMMLSLPDDWDYSIAGLVAICKENETAIKTALKELKQCGYLKVVKHTPSETDTGRFEYEYIVYENPEQEVEKQGVENLPVETQGVEKQGQLNTNQSSTDELNTKDIIAYLNERTGRHYVATDKVRKLVRARQKEGFTEDDFKTVIDKKSREWLHDTKMNQYLRPDTLFSNKFQGYLNQTVASKNPFRDKLGGMA